MTLPLYQRIQADNQVLNMVQDQVANIFQATQRDLYALGVAKVVRGKLTIGATGAVSSSSFATSDVQSVTRTGTGLYTLSLAPSFLDLLSCAFSFESSSAAQLAGQVVGYDATAKTVSIAVLAGAAYVDPPNGSKVILRLELDPAT